MPHTCMSTMFVQFTGKNISNAVYNTGLDYPRCSHSRDGSVSVFFAGCRQDRVPMCFFGRKAKYNLTNLNRDESNANVHVKDKINN